MSSSPSLNFPYVIRCLLFILKKFSSYNVFTIPYDSIMKAWRTLEIENDTPVRYYLRASSHYCWLAWSLGYDPKQPFPMHTPLFNPLLGDFVSTYQLLLRYLPSDSAKVVEVGCGRGYTSLRLATLIPECSFEGWDLFHEHVNLANTFSSQKHISNVTFKEKNMLSMCHPCDVESVHLAFGIETCCYMDTYSKRSEFLRQWSKRLASDGILIIIDGFRCNEDPSDTEAVDSFAYEALSIAEKGFSINRFPMVLDWTQGAREHGFSLINNIDLTQWALPFWKIGGSLGLHCRFIVPFIKYLSPNVLRTYLAGSSVGCTLEFGAAEYRMLVFKKGINR